MTRPRDELERLARETEAEEALGALPAGPRPSPGRRASLLASLEPASRFSAFRERLAHLIDVLPERADALLRHAAEAGGDGWYPDRVPGVKLFDFDGGPRVAGADCGLVTMAPGTSYPMHRHRGDEWALVLQGRAVTDDGTVWSPGDLIHSPTGSAHGFEVQGELPFVFAIVLHEGIEPVR